MTTIVVNHIQATTHHCGCLESIAASLAAPAR
jgi:hypothetical protein